MFIFELGILKKSKDATCVERPVKTGLARSDEGCFLQRGQDPSFSLNVDDVGVSPGPLEACGNHDIVHPSGDGSRLDRDSLCGL